MRMRAMIHLIDPGAMSHPATLKALEGRQSREVDIQTGIFWQSLLQHHLNNLQHPIAQRGEISIFIIIATTEGYTWNMLHTALFSYTHSSRIMIVHTRIITMVDTTDNQIWLAISKKLIQRQLHTVYRRTAT